MTTDPTIKPALIEAAAADVKVLQNLGRMKEFDPKKWVDDSYIRKAYAELNLDYDAALKSTSNYEVSGEDRFCHKAIDNPRKAGEVWVDGEGILPFSSAACTLGAYADLTAKGKKIDVAYVFAIRLPRPRREAMMMSPEFLELRRGLMALIREESIKAMGGEISDLAMDGLSIDLHGQTLADLV